MRVQPYEDRFFSKNLPSPPAARCPSAPGLTLRRSTAFVEGAREGPACPVTAEVAPPRRELKDLFAPSCFAHVCSFAEEPVVGRFKEPSA